MLMGEYQHSIDSKGRLIVPAKFREELGQSFIITRGLDGCLFGYPISEWENVQKKLQQLPLAKKQSRQFVRFFYSAATECVIDKQGRINLPQTLIDFADLTKTCYFVGVSQRIEIWSQERWENFTNEAEQSYEEIAEEMIDFGF